MLGRWRGTPTNDTRDIELNAIGVLKRREIEARILAPLIDALSREFGREKVLQIVRETIVGIARDQGRQLVQISGGAPLALWPSRILARRMSLLILSCRSCRSCGFCSICSCV
jgi:hypothetical protein